jgi:hypothetical protein
VKELGRDGLARFIVDTQVGPVDHDDTSGLRDPVGLQEIGEFGGRIVEGGCRHDHGCGADLLRHLLAKYPLRPRMLHNMRKLVREQIPPRRGPWCIPTFSKHDVAAKGVRMGLQRARGSCRRCIAVDAHLADIDSERLRHARRDPGVQRLTG